MKDYESALEGYEQALEMKKRVGIEKSEELNFLQNIALVYCKRHKFNEALEQLQDIKKEKILLYGGENHPEVAKVVLDIGMLSYNFYF